MHSPSTLSWPLYLYDLSSTLLPLEKNLVVYCSLWSLSLKCHYPYSSGPTWGSVSRLHHWRATAKANMYNIQLYLWCCNALRNYINLYHTYPMTSIWSITSNQWPSSSFRSSSIYTTWNFIVKHLVVTLFSKIFLVATIHIRKFSKFWTPVIEIVIVLILRSWRCL